MKLRLIVILSSVLLSIFGLATEGKAQYTDTKIHYWNPNKIKAAYVGTGMQYVEKNNPDAELYYMMKDLQNRHYNLLLLLRGGITVEPTVNGFIVAADIPDIGHDLGGDPDYINFQYFSGSRELVFGVGENTMELIRSLNLIPSDFNEKIFFYKNLFRSSVNNWAYQFEKKYRTVHINAEYWSKDPEHNTDDEAATIALTELFFKEREWQVSVSFGDDWKIDNIIKMYNAGANRFYYQAYNLTINTKDILIVKIENWRDKFAKSGLLSSDNFIITFPYYENFPFKEMHPITEDITFYYDALKNYVNFERIGGGAVFIYSAYDKGNALPRQVICEKDCDKMNLLPPHVIRENDKIYYFNVKCFNDFDRLFYYYDELFNIIKPPKNLRLVE